MSNKARVKKDAWASDEDAGDLLAGILDETATAASAEQQRLADELAQRQAAEQAAKEAEEARKRESAEARMSAEADRQVQLQEKRTARLEAIKIEDLKARGEWVDPAETARKEREEAARQAALQGKPPEKAAESTPAPAPVAAAPAPAAPKKSNAPLFALAAVFVAVIGAVAVIFGMGVGQYEADETPYAKVAMAPVEADSLVKVGGFVPLPEAVAVASNSESSTKTKSKSKTRRRKKSTKKKKKKGLSLDLGGDSLF